MRWRRYHYYAGHEPLPNGVGIDDLAMLVLFALVLTVIALASTERRDLGA